MYIFKIFFSTRIWIAISVMCSFVVWLHPLARNFVQGNEERVLLVQIGVLLLSTVISLWGVYSVEGVKGFIKDNLGDVIILIISSNALTYMVSKEGIAGYWLPLVMMGISIFFAFFDYLFSLNGGASKLLEMDKERISVDRNWFELPSIKKSPFRVIGRVKMRLRYWRSLW